MPVPMKPETDAEKSERLKPIRRVRGGASSDQLRAFAKLDPTVARRLLDLGKSVDPSDTDRLDEVTEMVGWGDNKDPWLDYFLTCIKSGYFDKRDRVYIKSALTNLDPPVEEIQAPPAEPAPKPVKRVRKASPGGVFKSVTPARKTVKRTTKAATKATSTRKKVSK